MHGAVKPLQAVVLTLFLEDGFGVGWAHSRRPLVPRPSKRSCSQSSGGASLGMSAVVLHGASTARVTGM